ncbi:hypothetical protein PCE1_001672 [Barthelona sp. PCE]
MAFPLNLSYINSLKEIPEDLQNSVEKLKAEEHNMLVNNFGLLIESGNLTRETEQFYKKSTETLNHCNSIVEDITIDLSTQRERFTHIMDEKNVNLKVLTNFNQHIMLLDLYNIVNGCIEEKEFEYAVSLVNKFGKEKGSGLLGSIFESMQECKQLIIKELLNTFSDYNITSVDMLKHFGYLRTLDLDDRIISFLIIDGAIEIYKKETYKSIKNISENFCQRYRQVLRVLRVLSIDDEHISRFLLINISSVLNRNLENFLKEIIQSKTISEYLKEAQLFIEGFLDIDIDVTILCYPIFVKYLAPLYLHRFTHHIHVMVQELASNKRPDKCYNTLQKEIRKVIDIDHSQLVTDAIRVASEHTLRKFSQEQSASVMSMIQKALQ